MVNEANVATAAMAIAISALVIAAGQLIAQLFSTADGYRRCQPSVIGDWYKLVELKFRWSSFRYEVIVTTPHFEMATMSHCGHRESFLLDQNRPIPTFPDPKSIYWRMQKARYLVPHLTSAPLLGTEGSRLGTFCRSHYLSKSYADDVPTWITLLEDAHIHQRETVMNRYQHQPHDILPNDLKLICISRKIRSWDFMPPDIVRPVASTTVGCLITMAHRLGMAWSDFRIDEGKMRAAGSGRSFSTSIVRGMGLVVEYSTTGPHPFPDHEWRINSTAADQMACGILPIIASDKGLLLRNKQMPDVPDLRHSSDIMGIHGDARLALEASISCQDPAHRLPGFTDIIGLFCKWPLIDNMALNAVDNPFPFPLTTMGERPESRNVWRFLLKRQEAQLSNCKQHVLQFYESWEGLAPWKFEGEHRIERTDTRELDFFKRAFVDTTAYLERSLGGLYVPLYSHAVRCHISVNVQSYELALRNTAAQQNKGRGHPLPTGLDPIFTERAYIYADNVPKFVEQMEQSHHHNGNKNISYEDVWWTMMMRLHAWTMSVRWMDREGVKIPSEYYDNPIRVYIL